MIMEENPSTAEQAMNTACRAVVDTPVSNETTTNMFSGMRNSEDICHHDQRKSLYARDD